jgi:hypothetical protein
MLNPRAELYNYGGRALSIEFNGRWRDFNLNPVVRAASVRFGAEP